MPQTLTLGSNDPDVILLQTTLNNRPPTALALLLVDGNFGLITLQRVQEFQTNNGLLADGIVGPITWGTLLPNNPAPKQTFYTEGRYLFDRLGNKVILRGINKMSVFDQDPDPAGSVSFPEIRKTGANTVRIVWAIRTDLKPGISDTDPKKLDALITTAKANRLIPTIELQDGTCEWNRLQELVDYWIQPEIVDIIQKHQEYLLVNIGNEVGDDTVTDAEFVAGYTNAIQAMRAAGIHTPLIIDAAGCGQNIEILDASAFTLLNADPDRNLLFSVHIYWSKKNSAPNRIRTSLENSVNLGYPLIVGEFSKFGAYTGLGKSVCTTDGEVDYQAVIEVCDQNEIGWYAWEWGPGNEKGTPPDPLCVVMNMTPDRLFANLEPGWPEEVAISSPYSIKNTSVTPPTM
jgi:mannan endo-1,4-beta-mannosidase